MISAKRRARHRETLDTEAPERPRQIRRKTKQSVEEGVFTSLPAALGAALAISLAGTKGITDLNALLAGGGATALLKAILWALTGTMAPERNGKQELPSVVHERESELIEEVVPHRRPRDQGDGITGDGAVERRSISDETAMELHATLRRLEPTERELLRQVENLQRYLS